MRRATMAKLWRERAPDVGEEGQDPLGVLLRYKEFAALFCREHAELHPVKIMFFEVDEQDYGPLDRLRGKQPLDTDFIKVSTVASFECPH